MQLMLHHDINGSKIKKLRSLKMSAATSPTHHCSPEELEGIIGSKLGGTTIVAIDSTGKLLGGEVIHDIPEDTDLAEAKIGITKAGLTRYYPSYAVMRVGFMVSETIIFSKDGTDSRSAG